MKALSLWQPWASLVPLGLKTIETRSWSTDYRGPLLIHAAKTLRAVPARSTLSLGDVEVERDRAGLLLRGAGWPYRLPLGAFVAQVNLVDVVPMRSWASLDGSAVTSVLAPRSHFDEPMVLLRDATNAAEAPLPPPPGTPDSIDMTDQLPYGHFEPGRYAWLFDEIEPIRKPVPARGYPGLWNPTPEQVRDAGGSLSEVWDALHRDDRLDLSELAVDNDTLTEVADV